MAVVGLGALGNELVRQLGLLGVGEALLVDPDRVEESNLAKCVFFRLAGAVGRFKAEVLAEAGREWFPETRWIPVRAEVADVGWARLSGRQVLFAGVDRESARLEIARISTRLNIPVCDGGLDTGGAGGRVSWYPGAGGACHGCRLTAARRREWLQSWSSVAHPCRVPQEPGGWTATPQLAAVTAALQVHFAVEWLGRGEGEGRSVEFRLEEPLRLEEIRLAVNEACPFHTAEERPLAPIAGPFRDALAEGEAACWEWPVCLKARCLDCGHEWRPLVRAVRLRREGLCPQCGGRRLLELDTRAGVARDDPLAARRPEELGLPPEHLYSIRKGRKREESE
ncbi:MAG: ThiF family adenylyltransferase [Bryobacteraceae bacterium]